MKENWELFVGALAVGAGLWQQIKSFGYWVQGFLISTRRCDWETGNILIQYLSQGREPKAREPAYSSGRTFIRPLGKVGRVAYQMRMWSGAQILWWRRRPIRFKRVETAEENGGTEQTFSFLRGSLDFEVLLAEAMAWENSRQRPKGGRHRVAYHYGTTLGSELAEGRSVGKRNRSDELSDPSDDIASGRQANRFIGWRPGELGGGKPGAGLAELSLSPELEEVVREIEFWHGSRKWYDEHLIPWRRGYLFHGIPGTGKTSLARAVAEGLDLPVHVFDLGSMSNEDLRTAWSSMREDAPCMALIEDIDAVFDGRDRRSERSSIGSGELDFSFLLNCIDGIERSNGVLLIVTTNHKSSLDEALCDRAGRVDRQVEFHPLDERGRLKLVRRILGDGPAAERIARESDGVTATDLQERCCRIAIARRFSEERPGPDVVPVELRPELQR